MKLATLDDGSRDGQLIVVSGDLRSCCKVPQLAQTLQSALDRWAMVCQPLADVTRALNAGEYQEAMPFEQVSCHSPLPRAYQWVDGSSYLNHVELVRKARDALVPDSFYTDPLMYQGGSDAFLTPRGDIHADTSWGVDFEGEIAVVTDDVPMGVSPQAAAQRIRLVMLTNDVSLRHLLAVEVKKELGLLQSKPASSFSPVAVTPDELGPHWRDAKLHLPVLVHLNDTLFGCPNAGIDMVFDFGQLIAHAARTRALGAGTIVGSGTVSNKQGSLWGSSIRNAGVGYCCISELRMYEQIERGTPQTPFMQYGDVVRIEVRDDAGRSIFGVIENRLRPLPA